MKATRAAAATTHAIAMPAREQRKQISGVSGWAHICIASEQFDTKHLTAQKMCSGQRITTRASSAADGVCRLPFKDTFTFATGTAANVVEYLVADFASPFSIFDRATI
jgi:hypothetical protein